MKSFYMLLAVFFALWLGCTSTVDTTFDEFITVKGDQLMQGDEPFRFVSYNIPNLHYIEDNVPFTETNPWRFPDEFEIRDALLSIKQSGGRVARTYTLSVRKPDEPDSIPRHVLGPGEFNQEAFVALDKVLQVANETGIRLIIPFVDNWIWWGGRGEYAAFRGKEPDEFWTDPQLIADFKKTIEFVLNRTNTFTGVQYKNDKAVLGWETGNELQCPPEWTTDIAAYIKSLDTNHLVIDGYQGNTLRDESLRDANTDVVSSHHYEKDPAEMAAHIQANAETAAGVKPYYVGEFGFIDVHGVRRVLDTVVNSQCSGALIWSLRFHNRDGGFYWHSEPYGGNLFKAYHWPGFPSGAAFNETEHVQLVREKAHAIRDMAPPARQLPPVPHLLPIDGVSEISWQGSAGALAYQIERAESADGPWTVIAESVSDAAVQYRPLYNDTAVEIGNTYFYRVSAINQAGTSAPSNVVESEPVRRLTLVDECRNWDKTEQLIGTLYIKNDEARKSKEDAHRFRGNKGDAVVYQQAGMRAFQIDTFFPDEIQDFEFSVSADGESFQPVEANSKTFFFGEGEYDYYKPVRYTATLPESASFMKIFYKTTAELARIEIEYAN